MAHFHSGSMSSPAANLRPPTFRRSDVLSGIHELLPKITFDSNLCWKHRDSECQKSQVILDNTYEQDNSSFDSTQWLARIDIPHLMFTGYKKKYKKHKVIFKFISHKYCKEFRIYACNCEFYIPEEIHILEHLRDTPSVLKMLAWAIYYEKQPENMFKKHNTGARSIPTGYQIVFENVGNEFQSLQNLLAGQLVRGQLIVLEKTIRYYFKRMVNIVQACYSKGVILKELSLDDFLVYYPNDIWKQSLPELKICHFENVGWSSDYSQKNVTELKFCHFENVGWSSDFSQKTVRDRKEEEKRHVSEMISNLGALLQKFICFEKKGGLEQKIFIESLNHKYSSEFISLLQDFYENRFAQLTDVLSHPWMCVKDNFGYFYDIYNVSNDEENVILDANLDFSQITNMTAELETFGNPLIEYIT